jgi:hypothetical protein
MLRTSLPWDRVDMPGLRYKTYVCAGKKPWEPNSDVVICSLSFDPCSRECFPQYVSISVSSTPSVGVGDVSRG